MRPTRLTLASAVALFLATTGTARAGLITFDDQPVGPVAGGSLTVVADGVPVTFTAPTLRILQFNAPFPSTRVLFSGADPVTVTFGGATVTTAAIENLVNGRFTPEVDVISGQAFTGLNAVADSGAGSMTILSLGGAGISRVVYDDVGTGFVLDNFQFTSAQSSPPPGPTATETSVANPEPATLAVFACVAGACGLAARRRTGRA